MLSTLLLSNINYEIISNNNIFSNFFGLYKRFNFIFYFVHPLRVRMMLYDGIFIFHLWTNANFPKF